MNTIQTKTYFTREDCRVTERVEQWPGGNVYMEIILSAEDHYMKIDRLSLENGDEG